MIWDTNTGEKVLTLVGHTKPVTCLLPIKSDSVLVSGSVDKSLRVRSILSSAYFHSSGTSTQVLALRLFQTAMTVVLR